MENRRQPPSSPGTFNRNKNFRKEGDRPYGYGSSQNRDRKFQPRNDRNDRPDRNDRNDRGDRNERGDRNNRYQRTEGGYPPRDPRFQNRGGKFQPRNQKPQQRKGFNPKGKNQPPWKKEDNIRIVSELQITDGKHKGKYLTITPSPKFRTVPRRIREAVFKILFRKVRARRFLDIGAGCGIVGLEAISRGALIATMVERSAKLCSFIRKNMTACEIKDGHAEVHEIETLPFLKKMWKRRRYWDVVFVNTVAKDPLGADELAYFSRGAAVAPGGVLVMEHESQTSSPERIGVLRRFRVIVQGETSLSFYERR